MADCVCVFVCVRVCVCVREARARVRARSAWRVWVIYLFVLFVHAGICAYFGVDLRVETTIELARAASCKKPILPLTGDSPSR